MAGAIEFLRHQFSGPTEDGIWLDDCRDGLERPSPELFLDFGELSPFFVFDSKSAFYF